MIEFKKYTKEIKGIKVLDDISITFPDQGLILISGENGSGKTMLLRACCGLIAPTCGEIYAPNSFGVIIENPEFTANYSGLDNLKYLASLQDKIGESQIMKTVQLLHMEDKINMKVKKYSLGMKKKLAVIQALMENPEVLLLDEPFNALDDQSKEEVIRIFKEYSNNHLVVIATHNKDEIEQICDEHYRMNEGKIKRLS